ncbi:hypothetical protein Sm713_32690 [Streptomyces sp. TS71-3]|nr:hypothetical protein Sm713_32690 [Streptomyces sp. TS71-3]
MALTRSAVCPQLSDFQSSGPVPEAGGTGYRKASFSGVAATRSKKTFATDGGRFSIRVCVSLTTSSGPATVCVSAGRLTARGLAAV